MMRGVGDTVTPLYALALSTAIGLIVTPALIEGWFGLPRLGIVSGAYASGPLVRHRASIWLGWLHAAAWPSAGARCRADPGAARRSGRCCGSVLRIGLPTGVQLILVSLAEVAVLSLVNGFGSEATAAYGTVNQVVSYVQFPAISIAITASIFGAQAIGAGRADRLGDITRTGIIMTLVITGGLDRAGLSVLARHHRLLHDQSDRCSNWRRACCTSRCGATSSSALAAVISGVMRASGTVLVPMLIAIFAIVGVEVPVAYVLSRAIGINGVWIAYPVAFTAMLLMQSGYYWFFWRKKTITRLI